MIYTLSILLGFIIGYFVALKYAIIKRSNGVDAISSAYEAVKDTITPPRQRIISPSQLKASADLLKGLEDEE